MTNIQNQFLEQILLNIRSISNTEIDDDDTKEIEEFSEKFTDNISMNYIKLGGTTPKIVIDELSMISKTVKLILSSINKGFEKSITKVEKSYIKIKEVKKFREKYPQYVSLNHPEEGLIFYKKLKKEQYNYTEVSELIGCSRQLISKDHNKGLMGVKINNQISKENVYNYFIKKFMKNI